MATTLFSHRIVWFQGKSREVVIESILEGWSGRNFSREVLKHCLREGERVLWTVERFTFHGESRLLLGCYEIHRDGDSFGYSNCFEVSGPDSTSAPPEYLAEVPAANPGWRARLLAAIDAESVR